MTSFRLRRLLRLYELYKRYRVEELLDERVVNGRREILIRWTGFDGATWETVENCDDCVELLAQLNKDIDPAYESDGGSEIEDFESQ